MDELKNAVNIDNVSIVLLGNKVDEIEKREITKEEGEKLASKIGVWYYEVSALTRDNIDKAIKFLVKDIINKKTSGDKPKKVEKKKIRLSEEENDDNEQSSKCC